MAQNKVVRFILNLKPMTRIDYSVLSDINILKVEDRSIIIIWMSSLSSLGHQVYF